MTGDLHAILAEHRRHSQRIAGLVFGRTPELPFSPAAAADRARRAWKTAGLQPIGLHEARHYVDGCVMRPAWSLGLVRAVRVGILSA